MIRFCSIAVLLVALALPCIVMAQRPSGPRGECGGPSGQGGPGCGPPSESTEEMFGQADADDGRFTRGELMAYTNDQQGGRRRGGGPPEGGGFDRPPSGERPDGQAGPERRPGPPPRPGQVLPGPLADELNLTDSQQQQIAALQADVDRRLEELLNDRQLQQLKDHRPPRPPRDEAGGPPRSDRGPGRGGRRPRRSE